MPLSLVLAQASSIPTNDVCAGKTLQQCVRDVGNSIANGLFVIVVMFGVIVLVFGSLRYLFDLLGGNADAAKGVRNTLSEVLVTLIVAVASWVLVTLIIFAVSSVLR